MKIRIVFFSTVVSLLLLSACNDPNINRIPKVPVFLRLNLTTNYPTFRDNINDTVVVIRPRLGYEYEDAIGFGGVLVLVGIGEYGTAYYAYDLSCPFEAKPNIRVFPDAEGNATCKVCGSKFYLTDGWGRVTKGPSKWSLKRYKADFINSVGQEYIIVTN